MKIEDQLSAFVLAQIEWELEKISQRQYVLARRRAQLEERATLLQLGPSPAEVKSHDVAGPGSGS